MCLKIVNLRLQPNLRQANVLINDEPGPTLCILDMCLKIVNLRLQPNLRQVNGLINDEPVDWHMHAPSDPNEFILKQHRVRFFFSRAEAR